MKALCLAKEKDFNSKVTAMALNALTKVGHAHLDDNLDCAWSVQQN